MTTSIVLPLALDLACFIVVCARPLNRCVLVSQAATATFGVMLTWMYFSPAVEPMTYENARAAVEVCTLALDAAVFMSLLRGEDVTGMRMATAFAMGAYTLVRLQWNWVGIPFRLPDGEFAYLTPLRKTLACMVMALLCFLPYIEKRRHLRLGDAHGTRTQEATSARTQA